MGWGGGTGPLPDDRTSLYSDTPCVLLLLTDTLHITSVELQVYVKGRGKSQTADRGVSNWKLKANAQILLPPNSCGLCLYLIMSVINILTFSRKLQNNDSDHSNATLTNTVKNRIILSSQ